jgi:hypothetical protein
VPARRLTSISMLAFLELCPCYEPVKLARKSACRTHRLAAVAAIQCVDAVHERGQPIKGPGELIAGDSFVLAFRLRIAPPSFRESMTTSMNSYPYILNRLGRCTDVWIY